MAGLNYKNLPCEILGSGEAERPCDCCGNNNLETAVFIKVDGTVLQIGRVCASKAIYGHGRNAVKIQKLADSAERKAAAQRQRELEIVSHRMIHATETESHGLTDRIPAQLALRVYIYTNRPCEHRRLWVNGDWFVAVDTSCEVDKARWAALGFAQRVSIQSAV